MQAGLTAGAVSPLSGTAMRLSAAVVATVTAAAALPHLPAWAAALLCGAFGVALAVPAAADAALRRGHGLTRFAEDGLARLLFAGPVLRLVLSVTVGTALALVLLVRLSAGGPGVWAIAALAAIATGVVLHIGAGAARSIWAGAHVDAGARRLAQYAGAAAAVLAAVLAGRSGALPDPALAPATASALVGEAMALHRLWAGAEAWLLGQAVALSLIPPWLAAVLALLANAAVGWAVARLVIAARMPASDLRRAFAPASDAPDPPAPSPTGAIAAGLVVVAAGLVAIWAEGRIAALPPDARPVARVQTAADRIGAAFYTPGTVAAVGALRDGLMREDADLVVRMRAATEAGFDRVVANVDPFLDGYYSLWGEYVRMIDWGRGRLEERMTAKMTEALAEGAPFAELEALQAQVDALREAARVEIDALTPAGGPLPPMNPGEVRIGASLDMLPPMPELRTPGMTTTFEARAGVSLAAGVVGAVVARRVVARLAARGMVGLAVRAIPVVGIAVGVAADAALVELEEAMNREAFHAEIVAAVEEQRQDALALFE